MKQEDKELLLTDLILRFLYNVRVLTDLDETFDGGDIGIITKIETYRGSKYPRLIGQKLFYIEGCLTPFTVDEIRPYLRPMSSMTEEERHELCNIRPCYINPDDIVNGTQCNNFAQASECQDWLNAHHFDYRGLIEKNLALEAPDGIYNLKEK